MPQITQVPTSLALLLPLLASIMALSPLAIDLYLPAMPIIAQELNTDMTMLQNTLSMYLFGYALGLFYFGPQADKRPRRMLVVLGVSGFLLATLILPFVTNIEQFLMVRFIQAFVSSAATVVVPGTIREYYGKNTAKGLSYVSMIMMLAPMIAPSIGSGLLWLDDWQLIFYVLAIYASLILALVIKFLPNSNVKKAPANISFLKRYKIVLSHQSARLDIISSMMISLAFFAYITAIPFVYLTVFEVSEFTFSALFGANVLALMIAHFINSKLVVRKGSRKMLSYGLLVAVLSSTLLFILTVLGMPLPYIVLTIMPLMGSISMIAVNADAMILQEFAEQSGTATAVIGVLRFGIGALAGPILAIFFDGTATPFVLLMWCSVAVVLACQLKQRVNAKAN
ncbi:multidrug effflux MFS transporter [Thalassotalea atypica]|uniref:multidrug effflux MFS transporter n=1 Tax=Thalassotalea atypica TaxID=2054316 RepID=UPI002572857A|nr:multidrug effflux MFS transporter [Thalassotalea atypica]